MDDDIETIVDKSGLRMWHGYDKHLRWGKWVAWALIAIIILTLLVVNIQYRSKVKTKTKQIMALRKDNKSIQKDLNSANDLVSTCQYDVELAWKAYNRRNQVIGNSLSNVFSGDTSGITADNTQGAYDFLTTKDCNPNMDNNEIFTSN